MLKDKSGRLSRNAREMGLALALIDALRSGALSLPKSKQHASFRNLALSEARWEELREFGFITADLCSNGPAGPGSHRDWIFVEPANL